LGVKRQHSLLGVLKVTLAYMQGRIKHWTIRANSWGLAYLGASRLNIKTFFYWFFMFLGCSPRGKIEQFFDDCV